MRLDSDSYYREAAGGNLKAFNHCHKVAHTPAKMVQVDDGVRFYPVQVTGRGLVEALDFLRILVSFQVSATFAP